MKINFKTTGIMCLLTLLVGCGGDDRKIDHSPRTISQYSEQFLERLNYAEVEELNNLETLIGKNVRVSVVDQKVLLKTDHGVCEFDYPANLAYSRGKRGSYYINGLYVDGINDVYEGFDRSRFEALGIPVHITNDKITITVEERPCQDLTVSVVPLTNFGGTSVVFSFRGFNIARPAELTWNPLELFLDDAPERKMNTALNVIYRYEHRTTTVSHRINSNNSQVRKFEAAFANLPVEISLQKALWASYENKTTISMNFKKGQKYFSAFTKVNTEEVFDRSLKLKFNYKANDFKVDGIRDIWFWNGYTEFDLEEVEIYLKQETPAAYMIGIVGEKITIKTDDDDVSATFYIR